MGKKVTAMSIGRSIIAKIAKVIEPKQGGLILYGDDNKLPEQISLGIAASGTAAQCIKTIKTFIKADGFKDPDFSKAKANPWQTWDMWLSDAAISMAKYEGIAINVQVDITGNPKDYYVVKIKKVRKDTNGTFWIKPCWTGKDTNGAQNIPAWDPTMTPDARKEIVVKQIKKYGRQLGFIYYTYIENDLLDHYPLPLYYSGFEDIESDAGLQKLENANIEDGFKTDVIISMVGELSRELQDDQSMSDYDHLQNRIKEFRDPSKRKALLLNAETEEAMPKVTIFPLAQLLDGVDKARDRVGRAVCRHTGVQPVLIGFEKTDVWSNGQALVNSMKLFNRMTLDSQSLISSGLNIIDPNFGEKTLISTLNLIDFVPPEVLKILSEDEIRQIFGFPKTPEGGSNVN